VGIPKGDHAKGRLRGLWRQERRGLLPFGLMAGGIG
jgi:hypothetical protein